MIGQVSLIGAGPGDPELLTTKAVNRLRVADLVLYDGLIDPAILEAAATAQRFCVGKRAKRPAVDQDTINRLMIRAARRGKRVVRLKNGDPFVLGRGGEEALALFAAQIPFEVIPGVTSAVAAPELAGIPVTQRGLASGFVVVSGHSEAAFGPLLDRIAPGAATIVVLMGLATRARIAKRLRDSGWSSDTDTAVVLAAGTPKMHVWTGRLAELGRVELPSETSPGTIIIGDVVRLRSRISAAYSTVGVDEATSVRRAEV